MTFVRRAETNDIEAIIAISRQWRDELGYVMRPALRESVDRRSLYVVINDGVVGFANTRTRKDGMTVIYEIAVHCDFTRRGIGALLLATIPSPTRLKCTTDNTNANAFYGAMGFQLIGQETGRRRALNVWERN